MPRRSDPPVRPVFAVSYAAKSSADEHDSIGSQQHAIRERARSEPDRELVAELPSPTARDGAVEDDQFVTSPMLVGFAAEQAEKYSSDLSAWVTAGKDRQFSRGDWIGGPIPDLYRSDGAKSLELSPNVRR